MNIVNAVVVTYNRLDLLKECLESLLNQTVELNKIVVIDNCSTDDTLLYLTNLNHPKIEVWHVKKNTGGSGGFYLGIKKAYIGADFVWAMDDDTIPTENALEELISKKELLKDEKISFLASSVYGINGEPMNVPEIQDDASVNGYSNWYKYLSYGIVEIKSATLVSLLFSTEAIRKIGSVHPYFFIWGDDTEYTMRMTKYYGKAFFVGSSVVIHKRIGGNTLSIFSEENVNRLKMFNLLYRNSLVLQKLYSSKRKCFNTIVKRIIFEPFYILIKSKKYKFRKSIIPWKSSFDFFAGKYNKKALKNRFNNLNEDYLSEYLEEVIIPK